MRLEEMLGLVLELTVRRDLLCMLYSLCFETHERKHAAVTERFLGS
jgi:hypothetical protein